MSEALGPGTFAIAGAKPVAGRRAHLLVTDPHVDEASLVHALTSRGVEATVVSNTVDALVEFGRSRPAAVIVAPDSEGIPPAEFVRTVRRYACTFVIAVIDPPHGADVGALMLAGGNAVIERPYTAAAVWELLQSRPHALDDHARLTFGPLEVDAGAYTVKVRGKRIQDLPFKEFELLRTLMSRAPDVMGNGEIRAALWGPDGDGILDNTLAVHVARLRGRLQGVARIRRIRGRGYALTLE